MWSQLQGIKTRFGFSTFRVWPQLPSRSWKRAAGRQRTLRSRAPESPQSSTSLIPTSQKPRGFSLYRNVHAMSAQCTAYVHLMYTYIDNGDGRRHLGMSHIAMLNNISGMTHIAMLNNISATRSLQLRTHGVLLYQVLWKDAERSQPSAYMDYL